MKKLLLLLILVCSNAFAQEQAFFTMVEKGFFGKEKTLKMEATIYKPEGAGPFPVLVWSHGSTGGVVPATQTLRVNTLAKYFLAKGYVVIAPMRRGRGASEGDYDEPYGCESRPDVRPSQDLEAALVWIKSLPYVDKDKIVLGGWSRGGMLSVVYASEKKDPAVKAILNFVGGWNYEMCMVNEDVFRRAPTPVKAFFLYGDRDTYYTGSAGERYAKLSGNAVVKIYPAGHGLASRPDLYADDVFAYLKEMGL